MLLDGIKIVSVSKRRICCAQTHAPYCWFTMQFCEIQSGLCNLLNTRATNCFLLPSVSGGKNDFIPKLVFDLYKPACQFFPVMVEFAFAPRLFNGKILHTRWNVQLYIHSIVMNFFAAALALTYFSAFTRCGLSWIAPGDATWSSHVRRWLRDQTGPPVQKTEAGMLGAFERHVPEPGYPKESMWSPPSTLK